MTLALWCTAVVLGTAVHAFDERVWLRPDRALLLLAAVIAVAVLSAGHGPRARLLGVALLCATCAVVRYDAVLATRLANVGAAPPETVARFTGTLASAPVVHADRTVLTFRDVHGSDGRAHPGAVRVTVPVGAASTPEYGDVVRWTCEPRHVDPYDGGFGAYLLSRGVAWSCRTYALGVVGAVHVDPLRRGVQRFRSAVFRDATRSFQEPDASMVLGLLVGAEEGLPQSLSDAFRASGTSHILAVSGYNVVQLVRILVLVFGLVGFGRRTGAAVSGFGVVLFAMLVGDDASVVRAAVMGCVMTLAAMLGRRYSGSIALPFAAALMLAVQPLTLRHDVGFLLSFCAVLGLHVFAPPVQAFMTRIVPWRGLASLVSETTAATVATLPIILATFGRVPLVALPANLVVLPFIPFIMVTGALALTFAPVSSLLAMPFIAVTGLLLRFVVEPVRIAADLPVPAIEAEVGPVGATVLAVLLVVLMVALHVRSARRNVTPYAPL